MRERYRLGERLFDACLAVLIGALALFVAVLLIRSVWPWLLGIAAGAALVTGIVWLLFFRQRRW